MEIFYFMLFVLLCSKAKS